MRERHEAIEGARLLASAGYDYDAVVQHLRDSLGVDESEARKLAAGAFAPPPDDPSPIDGPPVDPAIFMDWPSLP